MRQRSVTVTPSEESCSGAGILDGPAYPRGRIDRSLYQLLRADVPVLGFGADHRRLFRRGHRLFRPERRSGVRLRIVAFGAAREAHVRESLVRRFHVGGPVASYAEPMKGLSRVQVDAFPVIRVSRVAFGPVARGAFSKLSGFGYVLDGVMASDAREAGGGFVRDCRVRVCDRFVPFVIEQNDPSAPLRVEPYRHALLRLPAGLFGSEVSGARDSRATGTRNTSTYNAATMSLSFIQPFSLSL